MKKISLLILIFLSQFLFEGCKKEVVGPDVSSKIFDSVNWNYSSPSYHTTLEFDKITSDNINSAAVMVYFSEDNETWIAVPFTQYTTTSNYFMGYNVGVGKVEVTWTYNSSLSAGDDPNEYYGTNVRFKVVVVPESED